MPPRKKSLRAKKAINTTQGVNQEVWGISFLTFGALLLLALLGNLGIVGVHISQFFFHLFGIGSWILPFGFGGLALSLFFSKNFEFTPRVIFGSFLLILSILGMIHTVRIPYEHMSLPHPEAGGTLGVAASAVFRIFLGDIGAFFMLMGFFLISLLLTFSLSMRDLFSLIGKIFAFIFVPSEKKETPKKWKEEASLVERKPSEGLFNKVQKTLEMHEFEIKRSDNISKKAISKPIAPEEQDFSKWEKPSLSLLKSGTSDCHIPDQELKDMGGKIVEKLAHFGIGVEMKSAFVGPTVTQFALEPDEKVKLSKITGLKSELALALSAENVRIEAPIPGKNLVGIETPNPKRATVYMKEILESTSFEESSGELRLCFGKDVSGSPIVESLAEMPHLLIAGATGSGKSVGMNAFLISMLFEYSPADLRFIMIDPKRVELMPYSGIPHLLTPVITEADKALSALRWSVAEMMKRLGEFATVGARNIAEYNEKIEEMQKNPPLAEDGKKKETPKKLPKIVIVIDELADLMMREHKKETEAMICRIAQMARAVGMHLIIATQRPSVDVITGLIKANIPTRISFAVTSSIDSRTVLDSIGAEDLLGRGDMLYTSPKISRPKRIQGIYISSEEIERIVNRIKITMSDEFFFEDAIFSEESEGNSEFGGGGNGGSEGEDDLLEDAIDLIRSTGKASASLLQRRLSVGYARAARILDIMEEKGMIGPSRGAKPREIYL